MFRAAVLALVPCVALAGEPVVGRALAQEILFMTEPPPVPCDQGDEAAQIICLIEARYAQDAAASKAVVELYRKTGTVLGQLPEQDFDGGYRGRLHLVPRLPVGAHKRHLGLVTRALYDFDDFFGKLGGTPRYRWRALDVRFFESVKRRTPSAYAVDWAVAYNVQGSLFGSEAGVRGTLFHEIFHLNDQAHGNWSHRVLWRIYDGILVKCGTDVKCLTPYTPDLIQVKGGTYYDFQPGNGVGEYAADIARRYYTEHRAILLKEKGPKPFKCGPEENARAWRLVVDEFFGGVDLVPPCP
ncbi:MAG: hypothetical protein AB1730_01440 [Myxococcota bacterium]|jgi:hypothetical protein